MKYRKEKIFVRSNSSNLMLIWNFLNVQEILIGWGHVLKLQRPCGLDSTINQKMVVGAKKQQKIRRIRIDWENVKEWWLNTTTGSDNGILKFLNYLYVILYPHGTSSTTFIHTYINTNHCYKICMRF